MRIALVGDIAPFGRHCLHRHPAVEVKHRFETLSHFLRTHDLVIGNLEAPFVDGERPVGYKSAHLGVHPANVALLRHLGITHVSLANNHVADYGEPAFERTCHLLDGAGIGWFGVARRTLRLELQGERIGLLGYCSLNTNPGLLGRSSRADLNLLAVDDVLVALEQNRTDGLLTIMSVHSGEEHVHYPSSEDVAFARGIAQRFNLIYHGHHPHVVQGTEMVCGSPLFYSLGNLIFDDVYTPRSGSTPLIALSEANRIGLVASVEVADGMVRDVRLTPIRFGHDDVLVGGAVTGLDMRLFDEAIHTAGSVAYDRMRHELITARLRKRRASRDLGWYLRRLNVNSLGMIYRARRNARRHFDLFTSKLPSLRFQS
ncbi:MAG: CapA family protein [Planctomycetaceae bacterium]